jgi:hypothetical protein
MNGKKFSLVQWALDRIGTFLMEPFPDRVWQFLLKWEGSTLENDPDDGGGLTRYGIDQRSHPGVDIRNMSEGQARAIYAKEWAASAASSLPADLGFVYFDTEVNCGAGAARVFAQGKVDCTTYLQRRDSNYRQLCEDHPRLNKFLHGWLNRTADLRRQVGK